MGKARQRFEEALKAEIWRAVQVESHSLSKDLIEEIGENAGLPRERVEREFLRLAGKVWAGHIHPDEGHPFFVDRPRRVPKWNTVDFPRAWFQEKGIAPRPPNID